MRTLRCICRSVNGMTEIALPSLFLGEFKDGEERPVDNETAAILLGEAPNTVKSPFFKEVTAPAPSKPAVKTTAQSDAAPAPDGGKA